MDYAVLTDPKRRCLVEELQDHPIAEIVLVLDALGKGHILRNYLWRTDPPMQQFDGDRGRHLDRAVRRGGVMHWTAEETGSDRWAPTLVDDGLMFRLPILFDTEQACLDYIATIPAGDRIDGDARG